MTRTFVGNLILLVLLGVSVSWWIYHYTELFPAFSELLALGGVFSWLAFVSKVLSETRQKNLQEWLEIHFFDRRAATVSLVVANLAVAVTGCFLGAIQVEAVHETSDRALWIYPQGAPRPDEALALRISQPSRVVVLTSWWNPSNYVVKVSGYPELSVQVHPGERVEKSTLGSFYRRVALLRPDAALFTTVRNNAKTLDLTFDPGQPGEVKLGPFPFDGHAFWIGCDEDVDVPSGLVDSWRAQAEILKNPDTLYYWSRPISILSQKVSLRAGIKVLARVISANKKPYTSREFSILPLDRPVDFVQEVTLEDHP